MKDTVWYQKPRNSSSEHSFKKMISRSVSLSCFSLSNPKNSSFISSLSLSIIISEVWLALCPTKPWKSSLSDSPSDKNKISRLIFSDSSKPKNSS